MFKRVAAVAAAALCLAAPVRAGEIGNRAVQFLYSGQLAAASEALRPTALDGDQEAKFALGFVEFVQAIEGFAQALYRHGLAAPNAGPMAPMLSVPVPVNANPEPLDYQKVRGILTDLQSKLDDAAAFLEAAGGAGDGNNDYVVKIDVLKIRIDVNGDGKVDEHETVGNVFTSAFGMADAASSTSRGQGTDVVEPPARSTEIGFDRADALWLAGYANVIAGQADFLLAHDFSDTVNAVFHRFFPKAGLPMQEFARGGQLMLDPDTDTAIADVIGAIHTINWPVTEPDRLKRVLTRFKHIIELSRENWDAIEAETDDNAELLPNPRQTPMVPDTVITDERIAAWRATLDTVEQVADGKLLLPHWRFKQGFDLKAYFETATRTDFVMILTGYGALPFIKDGPIASAASFAEANRVFGDELIGYAFWFN